MLLAVYSPPALPLFSLDWLLKILQTDSMQVPYVFTVQFHVSRVPDIRSRIPHMLSMSLFS